jgi:4-amino-4-deoxy-L-arabinose transferase-like glycosyltransferase
MASSNIILDSKRIRNVVVASMSLTGPKSWLEPILLALVLCVATSLRLWRLDQNGYSNLHYAATIRSMLENWHNFFFVAFDPAGFLSVDKPPVAFWVQAACARLLGFSGFSLILPQALEGVIAVGVIYHLVRRRFGMEAALLASLVLAATPTSVAVDRSNSPDSCLVLVMLLSGWALIVSVERSESKFLLLCAALMGVAFNVKMLAAYGVLPVFALVYLLGTKLRPGVQLKHLAVGLFVVIAISASWGLVVDSTPADRRPYVGSSDNNSVLGLILGHNGLERLFGAASRSPRLPGAGQYDIRPGFGGAPGLFRLAGFELAGQITWLFPLAAVGSVAIALASKLRRPLVPNHTALLFWGGWLASYVVAFSLARGIIHPYYTSMLAPPLAVLVGVGVTELRKVSHRGGWGLAALPFALIMTVLWQARILADYPRWSLRLLPFMVGSVTAFVAGFIGASLLKSKWAFAMTAARAALGFGLAGVLLAPLLWSLSPVLAAGNPIIPIADPVLLTGDGGLAPEIVDPEDIRPLLKFLQDHRHEEPYLLVTSQLMVAALIIVETGQPVIPAAGFMGTAFLTHTKFAEMVAKRQVRYALLFPVALPPGSRGGSDWAPGGARIVSPALWRPNPPQPNIETSTVDRPRKAEIPKSRADQPHKPINSIRMNLQEMELYDFRPDVPGVKDKKQAGMTMRSRLGTVWVYHAYQDKGLDEPAQMRMLEFCGVPAWSTPWMVT